MLKKITIITAIIFLVSFLGVVIIFPLGIKTTFGNVEQLLETTNITPKKIEIPSNITTLDIDFNNFYYFAGHILAKQSPDDTAYIEIFNENTYSSTQNEITVNYIDETTAKIGMEEVYGKLKFNKEMINKTIVKELQNYPDAILYIPTRMNLKTDYIGYFDNLYFNNKEELLQEERTKEEEEKILEQAERIRNQQLEEEERILERAEEIIEQRQMDQDSQGMMEQDY